MGDNGFRAGHVNGNAAAAPALATAEVFGQAAKIGRAVDDLGLQKKADCFQQVVLVFVLFQLS